MPTSSTVWCWSTCRSPAALTVRSIAACLASSVSMWSKKPTPVSICDWPEPSRFELELDLGFGGLALNVCGAWHTIAFVVYGS